jgi:phage tail-like protein
MQVADLFAPPVAFHFSVAFLGFVPPVADMAFQEVSGLEVEMRTEELVEGGENRFRHALPVPATHGNLKLKRAMTTMMSGLVLWCKSTLEGDLSEPIKTKDMVITLHNASRLPAATWSVTNAFPVKWSVGGFDAMKNELAIESIELAYSSITRKL